MNKREILDEMQLILTLVDAHAKEGNDSEGAKTRIKGLFERYYQLSLKYYSLKE